ncbi:MAG: AMP-binding protein, partial [Opitutales bacterium]|nr:AMP-binding protein [Opitutales bacterium]
MAFRQGETPALKVPKGRDVDGRIDYLNLSFRELSGEQDAWGFHLKERGICRGARVLLMVRPGLPLIALSFALFKIGAVPVVIDPGMGLKSFLSCVRRTQPDAMVGIGLAIWVARVF